MIKHIAFVALAATLFIGCSAQKTSTSTAAFPATMPGNRCVVSGEELGEDGMKPVAFDYQNNKIMFCCGGCQKDFLKDPDKYIAALKSGQPLPKQEHSE